MKEADIISRHCPVAAVIIKPIRGEGGDNHASPAFFLGLRAITQKYKVVLIADEVQTGNLYNPNVCGSAMLTALLRLRCHWEVLGSRPLEHVDSARYRDILQEGSNRRIFLLRLYACS